MTNVSATDRVLIILEDINIEISATEIAFGEIENIDDFLPFVDRVNSALQNIEANISRLLTELDAGDFDIPFSSLFAPIHTILNLVQNSDIRFELFFLGFELVTNPRFEVLRDRAEKILQFLRLIEAEKTRLEELFRDDENDQEE